MRKDPDTARGFSDTLRSLWPRIQQFDLSVESLGSLDTFSERLQTELEASKSVAAWTRK